MRWQVMVTFDTEDGAYELEFHRLDQKGGGIDYAVVMEAMRRVFGDLDNRILKTHAENLGEPVARPVRDALDSRDDADADLYLYGDDPRLS